MKIWGSAQVLEESEIEEIYGKALKVLKEIGAKIENEWMINRLVSEGAIQKQDSILSFPEYLIDDMVKNSVPFDWNTVPYLHFTAGANPQYYMPAGTNEIYENTLASIERLTILADRLDNISRIHLMGAASDVPPVLTPLYARLFGWKHIIKSRLDCHEIWDNGTIEYVREMIDVYKDDSGKSDDFLDEIVVYMISPLCLKEGEASRFEKCFKKGFHIRVSSLCSAGGTAPITLAGAMVQNLAEMLLANFIDKVFYNEKTLTIYNRIGIMDMKHGMFPYGRPEIGITNLAMGQIAKYLKANYNSNSFSADAKLPSSEAGMQKSLSAITGIIAGSTVFSTMGLLSVDEIISEEQLVIDNEFAGALKRLAAGCKINEETLAYDVLCEVGVGGFFAATEHTVNNYRTEHWQPDLFSRELYYAWSAEGKKTDREKAAIRVRELLSLETPCGITSDCEKRLKRIIENARLAIDNK